jgi:hypothetical protein
MLPTSKILDKFLHLAAYNVQTKKIRMTSHD